ncbi:hypothetical protein HN873_005017, partial [Arachis hypogaea]
MASRGYVHAEDINRLNDTWLVAGMLAFEVPCFSVAGYDVIKFPLSSRLAGLTQKSRDRHDSRILSLRRRIDALTFEQ